MPTAAELVDLAALADWTAGLPALAGEGDLQVRVLGEGHSNLTFEVARGERSWVLRRPPAGPLLPTAHDVVREYRVLSLLGAAQPPLRVPRVIGLCQDPAVIGAPFYVMEQVAGVVIRHPMPAALASDLAAQHTLGLDLVDALAEIHRADFTPFVDAGIGRPGGYLARQLKRWTGQREGIQHAVATAGGRARDLPDYDAVRDLSLIHI